jgi:Fic family protein
MENSIQKIEILIQALNTMLPMKQEFKAKLDKKIRLEFNFNSNNLEGNTLTYNETELLLIFDETKGNHTLREYEEMKSHDVALQIIKDWAADEERPLTETNIKNLNEIILVKPFWKDAITPNGQKARRLIKVGDYKEFPNSVQLNNGEIFEYASVADTPIKMGELIDWYRNEVENRELHPVALAALLHYKFVRIHPFDDGNGRISRLLMNYVLLKNNLPPIVIKSADKRNYLSALNSADTGDITSFIKYISQQLIWSLELSIKAAKGENIEEPDDIEKEIAIWKKQAALNITEAQHRNDEIIYNLYTNVIKEMFEQFASKHKQFYDMFQNSTLYTYKNNEVRAGIEWIKENIDEIGIKFLSKLKNDNEESKEIKPKDSFQNICIDVVFEEYKYNDSNPFSITSSLQFNFEPYKYVINYGSYKIEKKYHEFLDLEEQKLIITECIKYVFAQIKESYGKGKN